MHYTREKKTTLEQSRNANNSQLSYKQSQHKSTQKYSTLKSKRVNTTFNSTKTLLNQDKSLNNHDQLQQIIDTLTIYIKSANQLKNYLSIPIKEYQQQWNSFNKLSTMLSTSCKYNHSIGKQSQTLKLVITKINMFISNTQFQLNKLNQSIDSYSLSQLKTLPINYNQILTYTQLKYSQLLKQTYRTLNIETLLNHQHLTQNDMLIVKENKIRKLQQIKDIQRELEDIWNQGTTNKNKTHLTNNICNQHNNIQINNYSSSQINQKLTVNFTSTQSHNPRNLQILQLSNNLKQFNLRQLAKQQLQKQFLAIRIQAYNMYEKYINHSHKQYQEKLNFVKQEQEIIQAQLNEEIQLAQTINQEYQRLIRQLSEVKTINQLIKKRYILRESIIIDSHNSLHHS